MDPWGRTGGGEIKGKEENPNYRCDVDVKYCGALITRFLNPLRSHEFLDARYRETWSRNYNTARKRLSDH